jgi:hypothetical protein
LSGLVVAAKLALVASLVAAVPVKATLTAPTHTPRINTHWYYTVRVTQGSKPSSGRLTAQIVDPIGGLHPVQFGSRSKPSTSMPFSGLLRDFIIWPASARGIPLKLRVVVTIAGVKHTVSYAVTPRA